MKNCISILSLLLLTSGAQSSTEDVNKTSSATPILENTLIEYPNKVSSRIEFKPLLDVVPNAEIKLANGTIVNADDWNAVLVTTFDVGDGYISTCTASVVGPNVVLTAAHCVDNGNSQSMPASINAGSVPITLNCTMHPDWVAAGPGYHLKSDADYAICLASRNISDVDFENIDVQHSLAVNNTVTLTGYGCTNVAVSAANKLTYDRSEGILRIGDDRIHDIDYSSNSQSPGSMALTYSPNNTQPTLCPGDSGGPVFRSLGPNKRSIVAINSAVSWNGTGSQADFFSILAPLADPIFKSFLDNWMQSNTQAKICGTNMARGTQGCKI